MRAAAEPGPPAQAAAGPLTRRRAGRRRGPSYFVREGVAGFWRSGLMSVAAVTITMVTLVALGVALVVAGLLDQLTRSVERRAEVVVYLNDGVRAGDLAVLRARLLRLPGVTGLTYVSKDEALSDFQQTLGGKVDFGELLSRNPLPHPSGSPWTGRTASGMSPAPLRPCPMSSTPATGPRRPTAC